MPNMVGKAALVIVLVSAASQAASAVDTPCPHPTVTIRVWDALRDQDDVIEAAKGGIVRIFRDAGVGVRWVHCVPEDSLCPWPTGPGEISLRIFRRPEGVGRDTSRETGGVAVTRGRAAGIVYLHYDRLEELHFGQAVPLELAVAVTASHEIGHILLAQGHALGGIMRPIFEQPEWHLARQGALGFTSHQSKTLRETLCRATGVMARQQP